MPEPLSALLQKVKILWKNNKRTIMIAIMLALVLLTAQLIEDAYDFYTVQQRQEQLREEVRMLREKNARLEEEKARLYKPEEIEKVAREELGMVKPGEVPYVK